MTEAVMMMMIALQTVIIMTVIAVVVKGECDDEVGTVMKAGIPRSVSRIH